MNPANSQALYSASTEVLGFKCKALCCAVGVGAGVAAPWVEPSLATPANDIIVLVPAPATLFRIQLATSVTGKVAEDGPSA